MLQKQGVRLPGADLNPPRSRRRRTIPFLPRTATRKLAGKHHSHRVQRLNHRVVRVIQTKIMPALQSRSNEWRGRKWLKKLESYLGLTEDQLAHTIELLEADETSHARLAMVYYLGIN